MSDGFVCKECSYLPRSLNDMSFVRHSEVKKALCGFLFQISPEPADDPEKDRLRTENGQLKDDVDILRLKMEQIRQALQAKNQSLKDLGRVECAVYHFQIRFIPHVT